MKSLEENRVLTDTQKGLLLQFRDSLLRERFYLTGGTALSAFYLSHRLSEDLDFFCDDEFRAEEVLSFLKSAPNVPEVLYERKFDRRIFLLKNPRGDVMKVEFTRYPFPRCEAPLEVEGIMVDSLKDILVNKIMALADRRDPKDYVDLYCALKAHPETDLDALVKATECKFGVTGLKHVVRGRFLEGPPHEGTLVMLQDLDWDGLARFFRDQGRLWIARSLDDQL